MAQAPRLQFLQFARISQTTETEFELMQVYRIGPTRGAQRVGYARDPEAVRAKMQESVGEPLTIRTWDVETGRAMLAVRLVLVRFRDTAVTDGFVPGTPKSIDDLVERCLADTEQDRIQEAVAGLTREGHAKAMMHLRTQVFQTTQAMMGMIAGKSAAIVSRWEAGTTVPGLDELLRLRAYALAVGLPWEDSFLLDPPQV